MKSVRVLLPLMLICCTLWRSIEAIPQYRLSCPPLEEDVGGICSEECPSDGNCPSGQLCCSNGCGHSCVEAVRIPYHTPPANSMCPPVDDDMAGTCEERCNNNSDCPSGQLCCSNGCGHSCVEAVHIPYHTPPANSMCPPVDDDMAGTCEERCNNNSDCPSGQLCCSNGCGHSCVEAVHIPYHTPPANSMCPPVDDDMAGTCEERCNNNSDCSAGEMCCSNGCGHVCMAPMSTCKAIQLTASNHTLIGSYLPQCEEDGSFSRVQCHGSTGYCWCVEPEGGQPVSDIVRFKQPQCNCTYDDVTHYAGESFAAGDGCNECQCTLEGEVKCTEVDVPCPGQELFYSCPAVRADIAGICVHGCSLDSDCTHSKKCCYNGCGHTCQSPVPIPYVRLSETTSCPSTNEVPCVDQEGGGSCHDPSFSCDEGEICCDNNCASAVCLSLSDLKPCITAKKLSLGNSSEPLLGAYRPRCDEDGLFRDIQCHEHYCWCVETASGRPTSDMVPFENSDNLQCSVCVYNGRKYQLHDSFPATDGCNQCTCYRSGVSCTEIGCFPSEGRTDDDDHLWEWWHTILIVCVTVVIILGIIVAILIVSVFVLMRQNGQYRHQKMTEILPEKYEPEEVQFKTGQDSIELKVPVEDNEDHKPAHA